MIEPNEVVMKRYCLSWRQSDYVTMVATWDDDLVAHIPGRHPFSGTYRGKKAVLDLSVAIQKAASRYPIDIHEWLVSDEHAAVLCRERAVKGGETLEVDRIYAFHLAGGKITEIWVCERDQQEVDRFYS